MHRLNVCRHLLATHLYSSASDHTVLAVADDDHVCRWEAGHRGPVGCYLVARPQAALQLWSKGPTELGLLVCHPAGHLSSQ